MGVNVLLGSDDLLAAFAAGTAFAWDGWFTRQTEDSNFSSIVDLLFNVATFIYIGAQMPFAQFAGGGGAAGLNVWRLFVIAILTLLLKRIPIILALWKYIPDIKTFRDALFVGHFGPIGCGAIFISTLGRTLMPAEVANPPETSNDVLALTILPITYFFVLCSIAVHGLTIPFFAFSKNAHKVTRTWSRAASFGDGEPSWMTRAMRRTRTGESMATSLHQGGAGADDEGGMTEIRRILANQLANIGKGAIGGEEEKELRREFGRDEKSDDEDEKRTSPNDSSSNSSGAAAAGSRKQAEQPVTSSADVDLERGDALVDEGEEGDLAAAAAAHMLLHHPNDSRIADVGAVLSSEQQQELIDDIEDVDAGEDEDNNACSDWAGGCEMKRYLAANKAKRQAAIAAARAEGKGGKSADRKGGPNGNEEEAPMDRDLNSGKIKRSEMDPEARDDFEGQADAAARRGSEDGETQRDAHEIAVKQRDRGKGRFHHHAEHHTHDGEKGEHDESSEYPCVREWLEGNSLVLELCKSRLEDPIVEVINLSDEERASLEGHKSPSYKWMRDHASELEHLVETDWPGEWSLANARHKLLQLGIPAKLANAKHTLKARTHTEALQQTSEGHKSGKEAMKEVEGHRIPTPPAGKGKEMRRSTSRNDSDDDDNDDDNQEESERDRMERAQMLYAAMNWSSRERPDDGTEASPATPPGSSDQQPGRGSKRPTPLRLRSSKGSKSPPGTGSGSGGSSSRSPSRRGSASGASPDARDVPVVKIIQPRPVGARKESMRRKLLAGKIGLTGRRPSASGAAGKNAADDETTDIEEEDENDGEPPRSAPGSTSKTMPKNFPRSASLGGLGIGAHDDDDAASSGQQTPGSASARGHLRSSSIVWLDVADVRHDRTPATPTSASSRRPRARVSSNVPITATSGTASPASSGGPPLERTVQFGDDTGDVTDAGSATEASSGHKSRHQGRGLVGLLSSLRSGGSRKTASGGDEAGEDRELPRAATEPLTTVTEHRPLEVSHHSILQNPTPSPSRPASIHEEETHG